MPEYDENAAVPRAKRSTGGCFGRGCLSVTVIGLLAFTISFSFMGRYRPSVPPAVTLTPTNGFNDYVAAGKMLRATGGINGAYVKLGKAPAGFADINMPLDVKRALVSMNRLALRQLRQAIDKQTTVPGGRSVADLYPYLLDERELARLIAAETDVKIADRDVDGAMEAALDGIKMSQDMRRGGGIIHGIVSAAAQRTVLRSMIDHVEQLSSAECERASARLEHLLSQRPSSAEVLQGERYLMLSSVSCASITDLNTILHGQNANAPLPIEQKSLGDIGWHFLRDTTLHEMERYYNAQQAEWSKPASERQPVAEPLTPVAKALAPSFSNSLRSLDQADVQARILLLALKIRSARLKSGHLPGSIAELGLPAVLTTDPFDGQTLRYLPAGQDYLLYSVGYNFKDDGGVPANEASFQIVPKGDLGLRSFRYNANGTQFPRSYRRVPYMRPPVLPKNAPPLYDN